jgi:DNA helicase-2/ATP-dependent DNA helicase PcrA
MFDRMQKKTPSSTQQPAGPRPAPRPMQTAMPSTHVPSPNFAPDDPATMEAGMEVEHQKFGFGTITTMDGPMNNRVATVNFPKAGGEKKIMLNYARLMIVKK